MKKGLRLIGRVRGSHITDFKPCPDEEGIKTSLPQTSQSNSIPLNLALMKKGLRPSLNELHTHKVTFRSCIETNSLIFIKQNLVKSV